MKDLKTIVFGFAIFVVLAVLMFLIAGQTNTKRAVKLYKQGLEFYKKQDYQNAYYNFSKISLFSKINEIALLRQADSALKLDDNKVAYSKFTILSKISKDKNIAPYALYNAALIDMENKKYSHAYKKLNKIYKKYPDSDFKKAACFQLGLLYKAKNPHKALEYFTEYLHYAPLGRYSLSAIDEIRELNLVLTAEQKLIIADSLYHNSKYNTALSYIKDLASPGAMLLAAKIYEVAGNNAASNEMYLKALINADNSLDKEEISYAVDKYLSMQNVSRKDACLALLKQTKKSAAYPAVLYAYARTIPKMQANKCYETIYQKYPSSYEAAQALYNVIFYTYENGYNAKTKELAQLYLQRYNDKNSTPAVKFWYAKILLNEKKAAAARAELKELVKTEPGSYYAYIAHNLLKGKTTPLSTGFSKPIRQPKRFSKEDLKTIFGGDKNLIVLAMFNDMEAINELRIQDDFVESYIAYMQQNIPYSVYCANKGLKKLKVKPPHTDARYKLAYPLVYVDFINQSSLEFSQNPYLMIALTKEESTFNKTAISAVGAAGLMQLMPQTASSLGYGNIGTQQLFEPELNIKLGVKYFSMLKNMFEDNEMLSVLAYNGGPGSVRLWMGELNRKSFDEFVETIPYSETRNYIKKVFACYWNYSRIYGK